VLLLLAACAVPVAQPPATATWNAFIREANHQSSLGAGASNDILNTLLLSHFQGQSMAQLISFFEANGFTCRALECRFDQSDRQNWFETHVGITTAQQTGVTYYSTVVALSGRSIRDGDDLQVQRSSTFVPD
jgi:hypothetical protein